MRRTRFPDVLAALEAADEVIGIEDTLIAATALSRGYIVVTANVKHFARIPALMVENGVSG
jgi:predicted nucleic acid-binding protein